MERINCSAAPSLSSCASSQVAHPISKKRKREEHFGMDRKLAIFEAKLNAKRPGWTEGQDRALLETFYNLSRALNRDPKAVQREEWWIKATAEVNNAIAGLNTIGMVEPKAVWDVGVRLMRLRHYHQKVSYFSEFKVLNDELLSPKKYCF